MFITASIEAGFTERSVEDVLIGVGGNGVKGAGVGTSTVNSTTGSGVGGSSGVGSGGSTGGGSSTIGSAMCTGGNSVFCDEIAVTTQSTMTNKVGTTIAVRGAESRWSSIRASLYSRVSRGIPRPLNISKSLRKNPFSVYLSSFMSHLSLLAVLSRRKVKVHLPHFFRKIFQRQRQAFGVGRMLLLAEPRRIRRIRSLGHSLPRLTNRAAHFRVVGFWLARSCCAARQ